MTTEELYKRRYWAEIDLDNFVHNFRVTQERVPNTRLICVLKADAYGHGAVEMAKALSAAGAAYFAVATPTEALQLRRHGITEPILLLGMIRPEWVEEMLDNDITVTLGDFESSLEFIEVLAGRTMRVHICVNTGMNRIGFRPESAVDQVKQILACGCFDVEGIWTHFAAADDPGERDFTLGQIAKYNSVVAGLLAEGIEIPLRHYANSDFIAHFTTEEHLRTGIHVNMARPGTILYGQGRYNELGIDIKPIISLRAKVVTVHPVKAGESVSYSRTWFAERDSQIAVVGIGYGDNLFTSFSNNCSFIINGQRAPQVGRVTMDQCMIDVTDIPGVKDGDIVTFVGQDGDEINLVDDQSDRVGLICTEITTELGKRMPRLYYKNGELVAAVNYIDEL